MHRFFLEEEDSISTSQITIQNVESVNHMVRVLRLRIGELVEIVTEESLLVGSVLMLSPTLVELEIKENNPHTHESNVSIDLFQCVPKGQKLELILQKNVELGVHAFYLVDSKRCIVEYKPKDVPKKLERLNKIIKEAAKQSKRDRIPSLHGICSFNQALESVKNYDAFIVLYENEHTRGLNAILNNFNGKKVAVLVGPEGGLEAEEIEKLEKNGAYTTTLGKRILRTETAGFVAVTCIQFAMGELE